MLMRRNLMANLCFHRKGEDIRHSRQHKTEIKKCQNDQKIKDQLYLINTKDCSYFTLSNLYQNQRLFLLYLVKPLSKPKIGLLYLVKPLSKPKIVPTLPCQTYRCPEVEAEHSSPRSLGEVDIMKNLRFTRVAKNDKRQRDSATQYCFHP